MIVSHDETAKDCQQDEANNKRARAPEHQLPPAHNINEKPSESHHEEVEDVVALSDVFSDHNAEA